MISVISLENIDRQLLQYAIFYCSHAGGNNIQKRPIVFRDNLAGHLFFCRSMDTTDCEGRVIDISTYKPKRMQQLMWRECIKKIWEVDPLTCANVLWSIKFLKY